MAGNGSDLGYFTWIILVRSIGKDIKKKAN
jgi:hypothetical protein